MDVRVCTIACMRHGGTHYIRPIVAAYGFQIIEPGNFGAEIDRSLGPTIVFTRDPRNRMASTLRWWRGKPRKNDLLLRGGESNDDQMYYLLRDQDFLAEMSVWANIWCKWKKPHLRVEFEYRSKEIVSLIATHLGLAEDEERDSKIFDEVNNRSRTYTGSHSRWQDYFGERSLRYWNDNGGRDLLYTMGYVDENRT